MQAASYATQAQAARAAAAIEADGCNAVYLRCRAAAFEALAGARATVQPDAPKVEAAQVEAVKVQPVKVRCAHYKLIRRFFAIAKDCGMDTSKAAKPQMRHAMETAMGRCVNSRSEVTAGEWQEMGSLIKAGRLAW